ncbi:MAG TPA: hypothetical protein VF712_15980 [Thermoleophilaceae bacterium]|jgi:hypothetical protein
MERLATGLLRPPVAYREIADLHLGFDVLSGAAPEAALRDHAERPAGCCAVVGGGGAGKSSLIAAVADSLGPTRFPVRVRGATDPAVLTREGFGLHVARETLQALDDMPVAGPRPRSLRSAREAVAAESRVSRGGGSASAGVPLPVEFRAQVGTTAREVTEQRDAVSIAHALQQLVDITAGFGRRLLLVVEDTDVFMPPDPRDEEESQRPRRFIDGVIVYLAREFPSTSMIAVNSRYARELPAALLPTVEVPRLDPAAIPRLIEHYALRNGGLHIAAEDIAEPDALAYVAGRYDETGDVRTTLDLLDKAARKVVGEQRGDRITVDVLHGL